MHVVDIIFAPSACQIVSSSCFASSSQDLLTVLAYNIIAHRPYPRYHLARCDTTVTVLSLKDIVVQASADFRWYAEILKTPRRVNNWYLQLCQYASSLEVVYKVEYCLLF